tara:strand:- start:1252 stop:1446 length:195 start_codon:yes stop_codon:yes gene_type:complete
MIMITKKAMDQRMNAKVMGGRSSRNNLPTTALPAQKVMVAARYRYASVDERSGMDNPLVHVGNI